MRTSTATVALVGAVLASFSGCGSGILLGSNDEPTPNDGGSRGSIGDATGPGDDTSNETATLDASASRSGPDGGPSNDAAGHSDSGSTDAASPGLFASPSACGYTQVDPHNCGVCGHDCAGGACQAGVCVPLPPGVLASGLIAPTSVAVDANNVYWLSEGVHAGPDAGDLTGLVQVMKCAKTGCNNRPTVLAAGIWDVFTGKDTLHGLTVDGANVYWATEKLLFACAIDGCNDSPTALFDTVNVAAPSVISVSGGNVYAVSEYGVFGCATTGCEPDAGGGTGTANILWAGLAQGVLADSTTTYWNSNGSILSCALGGCNGAPTLLDQTQYAIGQIAESGTYLYYTYGAPTAFQLGNGPGYVATSGLGGVQGFSKKGIASGGVAVVGMGGAAAPLGLATDGTNVYFTDLGNAVAANATDVGRVGKCSVAGCAGGSTTIADHLENPRGVAVDDVNVYWADFGSGTLDSNAQSLLSVDGRIMTTPK